ncbi:MAG: hypothetical protein IJB42_06215 [Oscillospiraceae bacterium]|nr:hypothetical protein [Oscillospiraceae bacterium]MBQ3225287.1 hypothetical protein [Oscillospiraceae bacterium]
MRVAKIKKAILDKGLCFEEIACELGLSSKTLEEKLKKNTIGIVEAEYIAEKLEVNNPAELFFD